jgi:hypothetical protein
MTRALYNRIGEDKLDYPHGAANQHADLES